jgi:PAS domain S-box-containing protein
MRGEKLNMLSSLRVLTVVDNRDEVEPLVAELSRGGLVPDWQWVRTETEFVAALATPPDLILLKNNASRLSTQRARELIRSRNLQVPLIVVADDALRENEALFRGLFEQAALGMYSLDLEGNFRRVNRQMCDIIGYTADQLNWFSYRDIIHPADREFLAALYRQLQADTVPNIAVQHRYLRKDGSITWVDIRAWLLRNETGTPVSIIGMVDRIGADGQAGIEGTQSAGTQSGDTQFESAQFESVQFENDQNNIAQTKFTGRYHDQLEDLLRESEALLRSETIERERLAEALRKHYALMDSFNKAIVNREKHVIELKQEVNRLCEELKRPPAYPPIW